MKKYLIENVRFLTLLAIFFPICYSNAQNNISISESAPSDLTVCMGTSNFSVTFTNNTVSDMTDINVMLDLPDYITYVAGSISSNATELGADTLNPVFHIKQRWKGTGRKRNPDR